jgi:hypothetical protein
MFDWLPKHQNMIILNLVTNNNKSMSLKIKYFYKHYEHFYYISCALSVVENFMNFGDLCILDTFIHHYKKKIES